MEQEEENRNTEDKMDKERTGVGPTSTRMRTRPC